MNKLYAPIENSTTSVFANKFKDNELSTSYIKHAFKTMNSHTINYCMINNDFCDKLIELIASIDYNANQFDISDVYLSNSGISTTSQPPIVVTNHTNANAQPLNTTANTRTNTTQSAPLNTSSLFNPDINILKNNHVKIYSSVYRYLYDSYDTFNSNKTDADLTSNEYIDKMLDTIDVAKFMLDTKQDYNLQVPQIILNCILLLKNYYQLDNQNTNQEILKYISDLNANGNNILKDTHKVLDEYAYKIDNSIMTPIRNVDRYINLIIYSIQANVHYRICHIVSLCRQDANLYKAIRDQFIELYDEVKKHETSLVDDPQNDDIYIIKNVYGVLCNKKYYNSIYPDREIDPDLIEAILKVIAKSDKYMNSGNGDNNINEYIGGSNPLGRPTGSSSFNENGKFDPNSIYNDLLELQFDSYDITNSIILNYKRNQKANTHEKFVRAHIYSIPGEDSELDEREDSSLTSSIATVDENASKRIYFSIVYRIAYSRCHLMYTHSLVPYNKIIYNINTNSFDTELYQYEIDKRIEHVLELLYIDKELIPSHVAMGDVYANIEYKSDYDKRISYIQKYLNERIEMASRQ